VSGWRDRLVETRDAIERRTNISVQRADRVQYLQESDAERRVLQREIDLMAYTALNYVGGAPQELKAVERRKIAQRSRIVWMKDPQAGAAVDLMNDFVFGRGLTKPKANDAAVQEVIDEAWDDPDNQLVLTDYFAQLELGTDFELQSNLFFLLFEDGEDGRVKLGMLDHDSVETVVRDEDNRLRVLYYLARHWSIKWDYDNDQPMFVSVRPERASASGKMPGDSVPTRDASPQVIMPGQGVVKYYEHWRNVEDAEADAEKGIREAPDLAPENKLGDGKVYHVAMNKGKEMAFGHPRMDRLIRWYNAYNNFMDARVDIMAASAAFVMKRKVKGTPAQLQKMANQALSRRSSLAMGRDPLVGAEVGPKAASILTENESVSHEDFNINTNAPAAAQDAQMIRSMISAATRWPQSYYGDASQSNLATATSLELPVLKAVETRQTMFEHVVRFFIDRVIERAVDAGRISRELTPDEVAQNKKTKGKPDEVPGPTNLEPGEMDEAYEDEGADEQATERDLGYEFQMPSPLQRMLGDLVLAVMNIAKTFDPNNTNTELSRTLLTVALQELNLEDPGGAVERILPAGYIDPAVAAAEGPGGGGGGPSAPAPGMPGSSAGEFTPDAYSGPMGGDAQNGYGGGFGGGNPYGAIASAQSTEQVREAVDVWARGREEKIRILRERGQLAEMRVRDEDEEFQRRAASRAHEVDAMLDGALDGVLADAVAPNGDTSG
jgi:hypothetical protein